MSGTAVPRAILVALVVASHLVGAAPAATIDIDTPNWSCARRIARGSGLTPGSSSLVVGAGLMTGLVAAVWLTRSVTGLVQEIGPADPASIAAVAILLAGTGLAAAYLPARRASRVSVLAALREE